MKHYVCSQSIGRIAGVRDRIGAHYYTDVKSEQRRIETHPLFLKGIIKIVDDTPPIPKPTIVGSEPVNETWEAHVRALGWRELRELAKDRGIPMFGKKAEQLIAELIELGG